MRYSFKKPRYRICFQTKNKVWIYKNSRLRNFYKIRSKFVLKSGKFAKNFLITKNMKWTVARRQMVPYFRKRNRFSYIYKNFFFIKQQLKNFYGGLKEYEMRNIFKKTWNRELTFRRNIFIGSLEQRLSMFIFRMRLLPTIYMCNQLVKHQGIFVNNVQITVINYRVKLGDMVSVSNTQWFIFYKFIFEKLKNRFFGQAVLYWRKHFLLKKIQYYRLKKKRFYMANFRMSQKFIKLKFKFFFLKKVIQKLLENFHRITTDLDVLNRKTVILKFYNYMLHKILFIKMHKMRKIIARLRMWSKQDYFTVVRFFIYNIINIKTFISLILTKVLNLVKEEEGRICMSLNMSEAMSTPQDQDIAVDSEYVRSRIYIHNLRQPYAKSYLKALNRWLRKHMQRGFKKRSYIKTKTIRYKRYYAFWLRKLRYRRTRRRVFKNWCRKTHWYTPRYLEVDYNTLRASFVYYPEVNEVYYGFACSFKKIISFYKERSL